MAIITVKVEEALKNNVAAVLDELGLDTPTAIRMYLKSIVRENGLPISTKLPAAPCCCKSEEEPCACAEEPEEAPVEETPAEEAPVEEAPAAEAVEEEAAPTVEEAPVEEPKAPKIVIDYDTRNGRKAVAQLFIDTICQVPAGSLSRWSDMEAKLTAECGTEVTRPQNIRWPAAANDGTEIPYWRIVGERGAVRGDKMIEQSVQEEKLKAEGMEFVSAGHGIFSGIKVDGYKDKLVKW
jgi:addiction module RelB/DinJ family antitoxin